MGNTQDDKSYKAGVESGLKGTFFEDLAHGIGKGFNFTKSDELYEKGYEYGSKHRGEENDSSDSDSGSICYLTTACTKAKGLPDNCLELETLRSFRDKILIAEPFGRNEVREYHKIAPEIVQAVEEQKDAQNIWQGVFRDIEHAVYLVMSKDFEGAFNHYQQMTLSLKKKYLDQKFVFN